MEFCWKFYGSIKFKMVLFCLLMYPSVLNGINTNCYYSRQLEAGQTFNVHNDEYPNYYTGERDCTLNITSSNDIKMNCSIEMSSSRDCYQEGLSIQFAGSELAYCGYKTFVLKGSNPIIRFYSRQNWHESRFLCELEALEDNSNNCDCGRKKETKIVGGEETGINEYPMMCGLVDIGDELIYCGCTIISYQYVLTAAHCVKNRNMNQIGVVVGEHDVTTGKETNATKLLRISNYIIHPQYQDNRNDIAVCKVDIIEYSANIGPVCLPFVHRLDSFENVIVTALGWGLLEFTGSKADTLQKVNLNVINIQQCKNYYSTLDTFSSLCTYTPGKDTCQMDSGGPLLWQNFKTRNFLLVGITSFGIGCASRFPAVSMRVGAYIDWIVSVTPGAQYCKVE